tara:strand:+ start:26104 stop:26457 length:354 start_codon:yes stop_codon:yes gene_type:complete
MKHLIFVIFVLFVSAITNAQDMTLLHINSKWNSENDYKYLRQLKGVEVLKVKLEDQPPAIKNQIKSVPTIILYDNRTQKPKGQWAADLSFKLEVAPEKIQEWINRSKMQVTRRSSTN